MARYNAALFFQRIILQPGLCVFLFSNVSTCAYAQLSSDVISVYNNVQL